MHSSIKRRLLRVATNILLLKRLKKVADSASWVAAKAISVLIKSAPKAWARGFGQSTINQVKRLLQAHRSGLPSLEKNGASLEDIARHLSDRARDQSDLSKSREAKVAHKKLSQLLDKLADSLV